MWSDGAQVLANIWRTPGVTLSALAPNRKGVDRAIEARVDEIVFFLSASESHNRKNLNRSIERSLEDIEESADAASRAGIVCRGAVAVAFGCPFEGEDRKSVVSGTRGSVREDHGGRGIIK